MTVSTVLSYVVYALFKAARDNLITTLDNEFCEEVLEAKEILWKVAGDVVLGQFIKRTDSTNRTKRFANYTDIVDCLMKLDQEIKQLSCVCGPDGVSHIQRLNPEDININHHDR